MVPNSGVEEKLFQDKVWNELGVPKLSKNNNTKTKINKKVFQIFLLYFCFFRLITALSWQR